MNQFLGLSECQLMVLKQLEHGNPMDFQKNIKPCTTSDNSLAPKWKWINDSKIALDFKGRCLKQNKATFTQKIWQICFLSVK